MTAQAEIQTLLDRLVAEGAERGIQVAAYLDGQLAVNAWAGAANAQPDSRVSERTLFPVFSTTKGIVATLIHQRVEAGTFNYDTPIASIWSEFGARGKGGITIRQALNHSAGLPHMPTGIGWTELCDWDAMCAAIAKLAPLWAPGTRIEYHPMTYGWILGEVLRRAAGRPLAELLRDEILAPLGIEDIYIGLPDGDESRVAELEYPDYEEPPVDDSKPETIPRWMGPLFAMMNRPDARRACIPGTNGIMNARSIARHYAALLEGGVDGTQLIPTRRIKEATEPQQPEHSDGSAYPGNQGLGYQLGGPEGYFSTDPAAFGHVGYGGSVGFADPALRLAVGLTKNRFSDHPTTQQISRLLAEIARR